MSGPWFLTADGGPETGPARTPMHRLAAAAGAGFERRGMWELAVWNPAGAESALAFADRSHLTKLELHAEPPELQRIVAQASGSVDGPELGTAIRSAGTWWCPVTPGRALVLSEPEGAPGARAAIESAAERCERPVSIVDVTSALAALALAGRDARELLARFCAIDVRPAVMPVGAFRPGSVARTPGYVLKEAEDRLLILFGWAYGEYMWTVVADAATQLGGRPVGADALTARPPSKTRQEPARA